MVPVSRRGLLPGVVAYLIWGLFPLYWPLLKPASATEILAHRIVWSLLLVVALLQLRNGFGWVRPLLRTPRACLALAVAALAIAVNWVTYIWGVNHGHVVETSLGYFTNPLVTVLLGVIVLRERLRRLQWVAVGIGGLAVLELTLAYGRLPWIAMVLAFSFALYGLLKKTAAVGPLESLGAETAFLALPAIGWLIWLQMSGAAVFGHAGAGTSVLLVTTGVVTTVPLVLFGMAARSVPLSTIGLLQYLAPVLQLIVGVTVRHEILSGAQVVGFAMVWVALAVASYDGWRSRGSRLVAAPGAAASSTLDVGELV